MQSKLTLGSIKLCITPQKPLRLCGFATRTTVFIGILEDIFLRVHVLHDGKTELVFFYADILWWNTQFVELARKGLKNLFSLELDQVFFVASHNHSGPPTGATFTEDLEFPDALYTDFLLKQIYAGLTAARLDAEPVTMQRHDGACTLNVFRRVMLDNECLMRPNYAENADHSLTVTAFHRENLSLKGTHIHYACHANVSNENFIQPDYPGIALRRLDETFTGSISLFFQGCTADLRPNCVLGNRFTSFDYKKTVQFADFFYEDCLRILRTVPRLIPAQFAVRKTSVTLPLENVRPESEVRTLIQNGTDIQKQWAWKVLKKNLQPFEKAEMNAIIFGEGLLLYTINAEISQKYAQFAREQNPAAIFTAYTNGMIGYLSTAEQIAQGGYEPAGSAQYFALAGTFASAIEKIICNALRKLSK